MQTSERALDRSSQGGLEGRIESDSVDHFGFVVRVGLDHSNQHNSTRFMFLHHIIIIIHASWNVREPDPTDFLNTACSPPCSPLGNPKNCPNKTNKHKGDKKIQEDTRGAGGKVKVGCFIPLYFLDFRLFFLNPI